MALSNFNSVLPQVLLKHYAHYRAIGVTIVLAEGRLEKGPPVEVDRDWDNAVELVVDSSEVPDGANVVHIAAMKLSDLTGDVYEPGYYFGYR